MFTWTYSEQVTGNYPVDTGANLSDVAGRRFLDLLGQ